MKSETQNAIDKCILRSFYFPLILYSVVAFSGYVSLGDNVPSFILFWKPLEGNSDYALTIVQLGIVFSFPLSIALRVKCFMNTFEMLLENPKKSRNRSSKIKPLISFIFVAAGFGSAFFMLRINIDNVISLLSSILCPLFIIIYPTKPNVFHKIRIISGHICFFFPF